VTVLYPVTHHIEKTAASSAADLGPHTSTPERRGPLSHAALRAVARAMPWPFQEPVPTESADTAETAAYAIWAVGAVAYDRANVDPAAFAGRVRRG